MQEGTLHRISPVPAYLLHSYLYYIMDTSLISDEEFDQLCKLLLDRWDEVVVGHQHSHLLDREAIKAGSGYHIPRDQYPWVIRLTAEMLYADPNYFDKFDESGRRMSS